VYSFSKIRVQSPQSLRTNLVCYTDWMKDADAKKLDQIIVMLADMIATFGVASTRSTDD